MDVHLRRRRGGRVVRYTEPPLPEMPPDPPASTSPPVGVHVARFKPRTRQLCSDCVALIHAVGVGGAPYPSSPRWQVCIGALVLHLCEEHKTKRVEAHR